MKKLLAILLAALMVCTLFAGCSSTEEDDTTVKTLDDVVITAGVLYVGSSPDFPPYESYDTDGNVVGFEIDLLNAMCEYILTDDGTPYTIEIVAMDFDLIIDAIQLGQVDMGASGFSYTEERALQVNFTETVQHTKQVIVVAADSDIETLDDLYGMLVASQTGTTCYDAASEIDGVTMTAISSFQTMFEMLKSGQVDAVACDSDVAENYVNASDYYKILDEVLVEEEICMIASNDSDLIVEALNNALAILEENGTLAELKEKWGLQ